MKVEFIGLPGSGKTTFRQAITHHLIEALKIQPKSIEDALLDISRTHIDRVFRVFLRSLPRKLALRLSSSLVNRSLMQFDAQNKFLAEYGLAFGAFLAGASYHGMSNKDRELVIAGLLEAGSLRELVNLYCQNDAVIFFEEGLVQKSLMFVDYHGQAADDEFLVRKYLESIPLPDLVIYMEAGLDSCYQRMKKRPDGLPRRMLNSGAEEIKQSLEKVGAHLTFVEGWLTENHPGRLIKIDNNRDFSEGLQAVESWFVQNK